MHHYPYGCGQPGHSGLTDVFGGAINLATSVLYGGARVVRTIVEGSVWHSEHPQHHDCCPQHGDCGCGCPHHVYHRHCVPETYHCCGCCQ
ncbi:MAG: hypothetical protein EPN14_09325 [Gallionella sp.]|nr:MAG: hypothetical protein EPN14_09325 [Gallionella sp.]